MSKKEYNHQYNKDYYQRNKERLLERNKANFKKNPNEKFRNFTYKLQWLYGLSYEDYLSLLESQDKVCAICKKASKLMVDHDHKTKKVRGLLCRTCNLLLGHCEDDPSILKAATDYLTNYSC